MTTENISRSISTKECCRPRRESNPRPPGLQPDAHPTEPPRPAGQQYTIHKSTKSKAFTKTRLYNFDPLKPHFYVFCGCSLRGFVMFCPVYCFIVGFSVSTWSGLVLWSHCCGKGNKFITKTHLLKYIENFSTENEKFQIKNSDIVIILLKT